MREHPNAQSIAAAERTTQITLFVVQKFFAFAEFVISKAEGASAWSPGAWKVGAGAMDGGIAVGGNAITVVLKGFPSFLQIRYYHQLKKE